MRLPWAKRRTPERRSGGYHDLLLDAALRAAHGSAGAKASATAAAESAAGLLGRAFASATAQPSNVVTRSLSPERLMMAGRALIRRGEIVFLIRSTSTGVILTPAETGAGIRPGRSQNVGILAHANRTQQFQDGSRGGGSRDSLAMGHGPSATVAGYLPIGRGGRNLPDAGGVHGASGR